MKITLDESDRSEILRYLGYKGSEITEVVEETFKEAVSLTNKLLNPKEVYRFFDLKDKEEGLALIDTLTLLTGQSIRKHLEGYHRIILFCVTLGSEFDREVEKQLVKNPTLAVIMNACGIQAVEKACDTLQKRLETEDNIKTSVRFSPGYGDLPLSLQKDIVLLLETEKRVGVSINENYLMNPRKTVTAIAGIKEAL